MPDDTLEPIPAEENPWYQLAFMDQSGFRWNSYIYHLSNSDGIRIARSEVELKCGHTIRLSSNSDRQKEIKEEESNLPITLKRGIEFKNLEFSERAKFEGLYFGGITIFHECKFKVPVKFENCYFSNKVLFSQCHFEERIEIIGNDFMHEATFFDGTFGRDFYLRRTYFSRTVNFGKTKFLAEADFSDTLDSVPSDGSFSFKETKFSSVPMFFNRKLHEDTDWTDVKWPKRVEYDGQAAEFFRRYDFLARIMAEHQRYDDEHMFFRYAMKWKAKRDKTGAARVFGWLYGICFYYGWSIDRAIFWWLVNFCVGAFAIVCFDEGSPDHEIGVPTNFAISFSNSMPFLGLNRGPLKDAYKTAENFPYFDLLWGTQAVLGTILLFFLLLTIRNRFRLR
ncbi:MAG: hypothetical protein ACR2OR_07070 [Hyphomicrobiales bacterium]